ncbi:major facilitator transporter [Cereibacter sphaeroides WS8N]|nr:major facilitator transporter [Cereibacter sphaeroides WS8N]
MQTLRPTRVGGPLRVARPALAAFGAMGICWGAFAAALPDTKALLGVDEARLGLMMLFAPVAAMAAMLTAARLGSALGRRALPLMVLAMGAAFVLPGQSPALWAFAAAMILCGAATGALDVLMNARVTALEAERGLPLMNLCHAVYSLAYAAAAIGTGLARGAGLGPGAILGGAAVAAMLASLMAFERDGTIHGLARPPRGSAALGAAPFIGGAMVMIAFLSENAAEAWSALHIERTLGGSATEGSLGPALLAITMGLARLAGQGLLARVAPATLLSAGALVAGLGARSLRAQPRHGLCGLRHHGPRRFGDRAHRLLDGGTGRPPRGAGARGGPRDLPRLSRLLLRPADAGLSRRGLRPARGLRLRGSGAPVGARPRPADGAPRLKAQAQRPSKSSGTSKL